MDIVIARHPQPIPSGSALVDLGERAFGDAHVTIGGS
jgi:hypothetical protein